MYSLSFSFLRLGWVVIGLSVLSIVVQGIFNWALSDVFGHVLSLKEAFGLLVVARLLQK